MVDVSLMTLTRDSSTPMPRSSYSYLKHTFLPYFHYNLEWMCVVMPQVWFGDHMFHESFLFYKGYSIPHRKTVEQYRDAIDQVPSVDSPEVFGLHPNADITYAHCWSSL